MQFRCTCGEILGMLTNNHVERKHNTTLDEFLELQPQLRPYSVKATMTAYKGPVNNQITAKKTSSPKPDKKSKVVMEKAPKAPVAPNKCKAPGCPEDSKNHGYCGMHWMRFKRYGNLDTVNRTGPKPRGRKCTEPGCTEPHRAKGYCMNHYAIHKSRGEL